MSVERIESNVTVDGNILEITPTIDIQDNSQYTIRISGLKSADGTKSLPTQFITITTAVTPAYCTLSDLKAVTEGFGIEDSTMLLYIREASNFVDFVASSTNISGDTLTYAKGELTKVKATLDCLMRGFVTGTLSQGVGKRYKLGEDELEELDRTTAFKNFLDWLRWLLQYWEDAVRGYINPGRAKPKATRLGIKAADNNDVTQITFDQIVNDYTRSIVQFS